MIEFILGLWLYWTYTPTKQCMAYPNPPDAPICNRPGITWSCRGPNGVEYEVIVKDGFFQCLIPGENEQ